MSPCRTICVTLFCCVAGANARAQTGRDPLIALSAASATLGVMNLTVNKDGNHDRLTESGFIVGLGTGFIGLTASRGIHPEPAAKVAQVIGGLTVAAASFVFLRRVSRQTEEFAVSFSK